MAIKDAHELPSLLLSRNDPTGSQNSSMEPKTIVAMTFECFRLELVPDQQIVATVRVTLQPEHGIKVRSCRQGGQVERSPARVKGNVIGALPGPP